MSKHISQTNDGTAIWTQQNDEGQWFAYTSDVDGGYESDDNGPFATEQDAIDAMESAIAEQIADFAADLAIEIECPIDTYEITTKADESVSLDIPDAVDCSEVVFTHINQDGLYVWTVVVQNGQGALERYLDTNDDVVTYRIR